MDWITGIQRAVDYVEEHITQPIDYEEVAKQAYSSSFHFQRVFHILCGFTLGEYIRMRRLSLAGSQLSLYNIRVIDVAYQYGYDTPESFSRAFTRFHGVTPSEAKQRGVALKSFSALSVKLILQGGNMMNYRIEVKDGFQMICKNMQSSSKAELTTEEISHFWHRCTCDGTISNLCGYMPDQNIFDYNMVGITFGKDASNIEFPYAIGVPYNGMPVLEEDLSVENISAHTYVVFPCMGKMPEAFQKLYQQIYSEFFPTSKYQPCGGTDFEAYPSADVDDPNYACEIWIAVENK